MSEQQVKSIGDRMKGYEKAGQTYLPWRLPVIVRVDGKAFHTWTRGLEKPFDHTLVKWMNEAALALCREMQGAKLAYIQSDEISIFLHNFTSLASEPWLGNEIQKVVSVSAGIASSVITHLSGRRATFDSRVFLLPEAEVANYFLWRQQDATRNSIQMLTRSLYSHKQCDRKDTNEMQEMCFQKGHNWNDLPAHLKRGRCAIRSELGWGIDNDIPIWKAEGRSYIERFLEDA